MTGEFTLLSQEFFAQWRSQEQAVTVEADRLRGALVERSQARAQNAANIQAKLSGDEAFSDRKRARLTTELDFLRTYDQRHLIGDDAVNLHIWIKYGLNYPIVMSRQPV